MKHRSRIIFCHIDLIKNTESSLFCAAVDTAFAKLHFIVPEGICPDQRAAVRIDIKRDVVDRTLKNPCQIFRQNILPGRLRSAEQKIGAFQKGSHRHLQNFFSIKGNGRLYHPVPHPFPHRMHPAKFFHLTDQGMIHTLFPQKL